QPCSLTAGFFCVGVPHVRDARLSVGMLECLPQSRSEPGCSIEYSVQITIHSSLDVLFTLILSLLSYLSYLISHSFIFFISFISSFLNGHHPHQRIAGPLRSGG